MQTDDAHPRRQHALFKMQRSVLEFLTESRKHLRGVVPEGEHHVRDSRRRARHRHQPSAAQAHRCACHCTSGFSHLKSPRQRAESLGLSVPFTIFIGAAELAGSLGLAFGVLTQWAALGLILIMFGAVCMKVVQWKTGFWGDKASGWHYDLLFIVMNLTILTTGGGHIALLPVR